MPTRKISGERRFIASDNVDLETASISRWYMRPAFEAVLEDLRRKMKEKGFFRGDDDF